ncbi:P-loop NTPase [Halalkalibacter alkalisediminis]|uniref:P-loop NTPase n=1 Tax=Halalkalibacter alkalisediminis TaxID=935616 RepID=A0ABV6NCD9_9BACI
MENVIPVTSGKGGVGKSTVAISAFFSEFKEGSCPYRSR